MPQALFDKIVDNLGRLNFAGRVSPYLHAEPLLENRLPDMISLIREACPRCYIMINSNGDLLNQDNLLALFKAGLNCLTINCYDSPAQFKARVDFVARLSRRYGIFDLQLDILVDEEYALHPPDYHFVIVRNCPHYSIDSKFLTSRARSVKGKIVHEQLPLNRSCARPFNQMYINYQGEAIICSEDWLGQAVMGNVNEASLEEIWYGTEYERYRSFLRRCDRSLPVCSVCDF